MRGQRGDGRTYYDGERGSPREERVKKTLFYPERGGSNPFWGLILWKYTYSIFTFSRGKIVLTKDVPNDARSLKNRKKDLQGGIKNLKCLFKEWCCPENALSNKGWDTGLTCWWIVLLLVYCVCSREDADVDILCRSWYCLQNISWKWYDLLFICWHLFIAPQCIVVYEIPRIVSPPHKQ